MFDRQASGATPEPKGNPSGERAEALGFTHSVEFVSTGAHAHAHSLYRRGQGMTLMEQPVIEREALLTEIERVIERKLRANPTGIKVTQLVRDVGTELRCYEDEVLMALARLETRGQGDEIQAVKPSTP